MGATLYINGCFKELRSIREYIKDGYTKAQLADIFNCSEEALLEALKARTGIRFKEYSRDLERNESRYKRKTGLEIKRKEVNSMSETTEIIESEPNMSYEKEDAMTFRSRESELNEQAEASKEKLSEMKEKLEKAKANLIETQNEKDDIQSKANHCNEEYLRLKKELEALRKSFAEVVAQIEARKGDVECLEQNISEEEERLNRINQELESYKTVEIYCDETGFHISNMEYMPDDDTIDEILCKLRKDPRMEQYMFKTVQNVAKIKAAIALVEIVGLEYSVRLEKCSKDVQDAYSCD